jgi:hypothetical protein
MRDADRRNEEARLAREGSPADVARLRQRIEAEDALDRLADEEALACLPPREGFERFGPVTRYLLERSRIELRWVARRRDRDLRLDALERDVAAGARTASPFETPPAPP